MKTNPVSKWTGRFGAEIHSGLKEFFAKRGIRKTCECILRFILGTILANAVVFTNYAPFGLGYVAAAGGGIFGLFSLLGVIIGSGFRWQFSDGLKYIAASVLIFAASFIFRDTSVYKKPWFMPVVTIFMTACVGAVFFIDAGIGLVNSVLFITEIILASGSAYFYRNAQQERAGCEPDDQISETKRSVSILVLAATSLISLSNLTLIADISLGRLLAVIIVLLAAYRGGMGIGSSAGISMGISMDIALSGNVFFSMAYAFSGMLAGVFRRGKLVCAAAYVVTNAAAVLLMTENILRISVLYEVFAGSVIFMLIPDTAFSRFGSVVKEKPKTAATNPERVRNYVSEKLTASALAFRELHSALSNAFLNLDKVNDNDIAVIFDRTSSKVCRKCALTDVCWEQEYVDTFNLLNDAAPVMLKKGRADMTDFPPRFTGRCMNFTVFNAVLNEEITALQYRRQFKNRLKESRSMICNQYSGLSSILTEVAAEIGADLTFDINAERNLRKYIRETGIKADATVYLDPSGRMHAEITGKNLSPLMSVPDLVLKLSTALGFRICEPEHVRNRAGECIKLREAEILTASLGIAANKKQGQQISGDCGSYFKTADSRLFMLLSDGMGSGHSAAVESGMAVRLLERFLRAGVNPETALKTLNSALVLKGEDDGSFVTIDLFVLDLFTGEAELYKYGAAPSYIKKGGRISRISGNMLPAGVGLSKVPSLDLTKLQLSGGDYVIMASDGVADSNDDSWLIKEASDFFGGQPRELAEIILRKAKSIYGSGDDMTVMVLKVETRQMPDV